MARTFVAITGGGAGGAFVNDDPFGYKAVEKIRQDIDLLAYVGGVMFLGGTPSVGYVTGAATWEAVDEALAFTVQGDNLGGMTVDLVVSYKTENAAQSVDVRLRNTTDASNAATSTTSTSTTWVTQTATVTFAAGNKSYRLEILGGATYGVFAIAYLRERKVPA